MWFLSRRTEKQIIGKKGEKLAEKHLKENGYTVLHKNYRSKKNEIDIVATRGKTLVFVEVKTTSSDKAEEFKLPSEAVDRHKKECLIQCAYDYIADKKRDYRGYRFDVIEVYLNKDTHQINHIENAFYKKKGYTPWNR